jgi:Spy/CpxP family protein refolding chaperone
LLLTGALALAQPPQGPGPGPGPRHRGLNRPPMERSLHAGPPGRWWNNPDMVQKLSLTTDQQKRMDDIFQQSRLKLIDLNASLQKEEVVLEPLVAADQPDESRVLAQIDRVAQARAELEKANARMLLGIRRVLSQDQWKKLQTREPRPEGGPGAAGGPRPRRSDD